MTTIKQRTSLHRHAPEGRRCPR